MTSALQTPPAAALPAQASNRPIVPAERRAVSALEAQESAQDIEFARWLERAERDEAHEPDPAAVAPGEAETSEDTPSEGAAEPLDEASAATAADAPPEGETVERGAEGVGPAIAGEGSDAEAEAPGSLPTVTAEGPRERAPERPVTIRALNARLLHDRLSIDLEPRLKLAAAAAAAPHAEPIATSAAAGPRATAAERPQEAADSRAPGVSELPATPASDDLGGIVPGEPKAGLREGGAERVGGSPDRSGHTQAAASARPGPVEPAVAVRASVAGGAVVAAAATGSSGGATRNDVTVRGEGAGLVRAAAAVGPAVGTSAGAGGRGAGGGLLDSGRSGASGRAASTAGARVEAFETQVLRGMSAAVAQARQAGTGELVLRLHPSALGQMKIRVAFEPGQNAVSARFEVATRDARRLIDASLEQLRSSLESRGVGVEGLEVQLVKPGPSLGDPLGLIAGTPYAESAPGWVDPDGRQGGGGERGGGPSEGPGAGLNEGQHGPEARTDGGPGSTDAPPSSLIPDEPAAERPGWMNSTYAAYRTVGEEGGVLRLAVDAIA